MERRLAAILAVDVVGYSRLMGADEAGTLDALKAHRAELIDPKAEQYGGRTVKLMGDGALMEFASVVDAVTFAVDVQAAMAARNAGQPDDRQIHYRVGINIGDIVVEDDDIFGDGVNVAARLEALAEPGGICVRRNVRNQVRDKLDLNFDDLGEVEVKNIARPVRVFRIVLDAKAQALVTPVVAAPVAPAPRRRWQLGAALAVGVALLGGLAWWLAPPPDKPPAPSIAVLPLTNMSGDPKQESFVDGITEEIITALSRFRPLHVLARKTAFQYKGQAVDIERLAQDLGVEYVFEGSVRRAADTVRVTAQLVETKWRAHLWAETYERGVTPANLFEVQDDIAAKVAAAVAASYGGAISTTRLRATTKLPPESLSSYECVLDAFGIWRGQSAELVVRSRDCLELAVQRDPGYADAWAMLAAMYRYQRWYGWGLDPPESQDLQLRAHLAQESVQAAQRAVRLAPDSATANYSLSCAYWTAGEIEKFRAQVERTLALNPNEPSYFGSLGNYLAYAGWWDEGVAMVNRSIALAPKSYAGWWLWAIAKDHYRKGEYGQALVYFERAFVPGFWLSQLQLAYANGMLGNTEQAAEAVARLREIMPGLSISDALAYYRMWNIEQSYLDLMAEGLRRAGLPE